MFWKKEIASRGQPPPVGRSEEEEPNYVFGTKSNRMVDERFELISLISFLDPPFKFKRWDFDSCFLILETGNTPQTCY